jgi:hypothetical protein
MCSNGGIRNGRDDFDRDSVSEDTDPGGVKELKTLSSKRIIHQNCCKFYESSSKRFKLFHFNYNYYTVPSTSDLANKVWKSSTTLPIKYKCKKSKFPSTPTVIVLPPPIKPVFLTKEYRNYQPTKSTMYKGLEDIVDIDLVNTGKFTQIKLIDKTTKNYVGGKGNMTALHCYTVKYLYKQSSTVNQVVGKVAFCDSTTYYDVYEKPVHVRETIPGCFNWIRQSCSFKVKCRPYNKNPWWYFTKQKIFPPDNNKIKPAPIVTHVREDSDRALAYYHYYRHKPTIISRHNFFSSNHHIPKENHKNGIVFGPEPSAEHLRKYMAYWQYSWDASYPLPSDEQDASYPVPSDEHKEERRIWMFDNLWYDWLPKKES